MIAYLRILRLQNLFMIALCLLLMRYCLIMPMLILQFKVTDVFPEHFSKFDFSVLIFATLAVAAAGNVINDYFDQKIDAVNKPGKNVVGEKIKPKVAVTLYVILSSLGALGGFYSGYKSGIFSLCFLHAAVAISLYMYSWQFKRKPLSGNFMIAFSTALVVVLPALFEKEIYPNIQYALIYGCFGFLISMSREIVKDIEDIEGDKKFNCRTFPITSGIKAARWLAFAFLLLSIIFSAYVLQKYFYDNPVFSFWNMLAIFTLPPIIISYLLLIAKEKKDFSACSISLKIYMLAGLLTMLPFYYYFLR